MSVIHRCCQAGEAGHAWGRHNIRAGITETSELLQVVLLNMERLSDEAFTELTTPPRHTFEIGENVARDLYQLGARRAAKLDADDLP